MVAEEVKDVKIPLEVFEMLHNVSLYLIQDDRMDLGRFVYRDRTDHYYHGRYSPDHPSVGHHWIIGMFGILTAQLGSLAVRGMELYNDYRKIENGDLRDIDQSILDLVDETNTVPIDQYRDEVLRLAPVSLDSPSVSSSIQGPSPITPIEKTARPEKTLGNPLKVPEISGLPGF